jgi:hypothetical protein
MSMNSHFRGERGMTLPEILLGILILVAVIFVGSNALNQFVTTVQRTRVRSQLLLETTTGVDSMVRYLSQAAWNTVVVSGRPGAMSAYPWSQITFNITQPDHTQLPYTFQQTAANELTMTVGTLAPKIIANDVVTLIFTYPRANDPSLLIVTLRTQKASGANTVETVSRSAQVKLLPPTGT